jgi:hypothetical protein
MQTRGVNLGVQSRRSCVFESLTNERHEEDWGEGKVSALLHQTISHPREEWDCGLQAGPVTILSWSSRYLPCVAMEDMFEGTCGHRVVQSDTC